MDAATWAVLPDAQREMFLAMPSQDPPPGEESNLTNPPNQDPMVIAVLSICLVLVTISLAIRIYSKIVFNKKIGIEDVCGIIAFGVYIGAVWTIFEAVRIGGFFVHQWHVSWGTLFEMLYPLCLIPFFVAPTMLFAKTAIILDWLRLFAPSGTRNFFWWACWIVLGINAVFYTVGIFVVALACRPVQHGWLPFSEGTCIPLDTQREFEFSSACVNLALDLAILVLPQRTIWTLNMPRSKKISVSVVFSIGVIAVACATGRIVSGRLLLSTTDRTYDTAAPMLWVIGEMTCAFLVFCTPSLPKFFGQSKSISHLSFSSLRSWSRNRSNSNARPKDQHSGMPSKEKDGLDDDSRGILRTTETTMQTANDDMEEVRDIRVAIHHPWMESSPWQHDSRV